MLGCSGVSGTHVSWTCSVGGERVMRWDRTGEREGRTSMPTGMAWPFLTRGCRQAGRVCRMLSAKAPSLPAYSAVVLQDPIAPPHLHDADVLLAAVLKGQRCVVLQWGGRDAV